MTFSVFVKILKVFYIKDVTNGIFVLNLIDESLEDTPYDTEQQIIKTNDYFSYNPLDSEDSARKYFDGSRKISRRNFEIIEKHFERNKFKSFLEKNILNTDDNYRHMVLKFQENGIECNEDNIEEKCADVFDEIIATADKEYKKPAELTLVRDEEQETFLDFTYRILQKLVQKPEWPFEAPQFKILKHELYELSQEDIDERFDISIENYNTENPEPSIKILIKCKKSNSPISKNDLVLFHSKVSQVHGCCKPVYITNNSFEQDALNYAKIMGIGILRIFDEDKTKWLAPRTMNIPITYIDYENCESEKQEAILQENYKIINNFIIGYFQSFHASLSSFLNKLLDDKYSFNMNNAELYKTTITYSTDEKITFIEKETLKKIADQIRSEIYGNNKQNNFIVKTEDLILYLKTHFGFSINFQLDTPSFTFPQKIQGLVDYNNKTIYIYGINKVDLHLIKFSIAHEISHLILHEDLLAQGKDNFFYFYQDSNESKKIEIQANQLANYILLDNKKLQVVFMSLIREYHLTLKNGHYLYLDDQHCNIDLYMQITDRLMKVFDVSREQIKYRLIELGWLKEPNKKIFIPLA